MIPVPLMSRSSLKVALDLSILHWSCGKPSSSLVLDINKISALILTISSKDFQIHFSRT